MNTTGTVIGRLDKGMLTRIIVKHPDEDIRKLFMSFYEAYPKSPDQHGLDSLIVSQPIQVAKEE